MAHFRCGDERFKWVANGRERDIRHTLPEHPSTPQEPRWPHSGLSFQVMRFSLNMGHYVHRAHKKQVNRPPRLKMQTTKASVRSKKIQWCMTIFHCFTSYFCGMHHFIGKPPFHSLNYVVICCSPFNSLTAMG